MITIDLPPIKTIIKPLVCTPTREKWKIYQAEFLEFFKKHDEGLDKVVKFISEFWELCDLLPSFFTIILNFENRRDTDLVERLRAIHDDTDVDLFPYTDDFVAHLLHMRQPYFQNDAQRAIFEFEALQQKQGIDVPQLFEGIDAMVAKLHAAKYRVYPDNAPISLLLLDGTAPGAAVKELREDYANIEEQARSDETLYYTLPFTSFPGVDIKIHRGDLVFFGAFAGQGKSTLLRQAAYRFLIFYGLNVVFWTIEMDATEMRMLFALMHANNKMVFPEAPGIEPDAYREGKLTEAQKDFLLDSAHPDFTKNPNYGTLSLEEPSHTRFGLADLEQRLREIEHSIMPVHILVLDYVTLMHPLGADDRRSVQTEDYNQLIKELKRFCLSYRHINGKKAPLICLTAAQVSRKGYEEALKRDGVYDLQAFSMYTEIERSADTAITSFMSDDERSAGTMRLQVHKYRREPVPKDPLSVHVDFRHGGWITKELPTNPEETTRQLQSLAI